MQFHKHYNNIIKTNQDTLYLFYQSKTLIILGTYMHMITEI